MLKKYSAPLLPESCNSNTAKIKPKIHFRLKNEKKIKKIFMYLIDFNKYTGIIIHQDRFISFFTPTIHKVSCLLPA